MFIYCLSEFEVIVFANVYFGAELIDQHYHHRICYHTHCHVFFAHFQHIGPFALYPFKCQHGQTPGNIPHHQHQWGCHYAYREDLGSQSFHHRHVGRSEENARSGHQQEGEHQLRGFFSGGKRPAGGHHVLIPGQLVGKDVGYEVQTVQQPPAYKRHVGTMPQTAETEDEQHHRYVFQLATPVAAHGQVQVVQHPFAQRGVPPPPELARVAAEERHLEVLRQLYAHQPAHAPCYL